VRILLVNSALVIVEGLIALGVWVYWSLTLPADATIHLGGWSFPRASGLWFMEKLAAWSIIAGTAGWLVAHTVVWYRRRKLDRDAR
jgi:hypothetical protein